jgi:uncharacterized membrane protein YhaH (DUF805 family)
MQASGWASLILFVIFAYPMYALYLKRRHDKDNNGLDAIIFLVVIGVTLLMQALGLAYTLTDVGGISVPTPSIIFSVLGIVVLVYSIYMLVVCGFLRGTAGPNQYGPDPLGGTAAAAVALARPHQNWTGHARHHQGDPVQLLQALIRCPL